MFAGRISFHLERGTPLSDDHLFAAEAYLAALFKNGQISPVYILSRTKSGLDAYVEQLRPNSLAARHHSSWARRDLKKVHKVFGRAPSTALLEAAVPKRFSSWRATKFLYLFTNLLDRSSPVRAPRSRTEVPLYELPIDERTREALCFWAERYRTLDELWIASGPLERGAYKQLADPASETAERGRELCQVIEKATRKPTYYYLVRYYGRETGEEERPCPLCGSPWRTKTRPAAESEFFAFDFQCRRCRLVSHFAKSIEDARRARVGEFRG